MKGKGIGRWGPGAGGRGPGAGLQARRLLWVAVLVIALGSIGAQAQSPEAPAPGSRPPAPDDAAAVEALIETSKGDITIRFFPKEAPRHVAHFIETARKGGYDGTAFHRAVPYAIVQGGDPLSKDPRKKALYGTGGLKLLPDEIGNLQHLPGAVSSVMLPKPDGTPTPGTSGTQFFICDTWQQALDGKYSVFGRVTNGMDVVRAISAMGDAGGKMVERVDIKRVTVRPLTPTVDELKRLRARIVTPQGEIVVELLPDVAPENARQWVGLARTGYYDGSVIYRAIPDYLIQGADTSKWPADSPNQKRSFSVWPVRDEFAASVVMDRGIVGMAHGDVPDSATVHFFILAGRAAQLDNKYTAFGRVASGMEVVDAISKMPVTGDRLNAPVPITRIIIEEAGAGGQAPGAGKSSPTPGT